MGRRPKDAQAGRAITMTQISISLPKPLVDEIDRMAELDNRNRSNFITNTLANLARESVSGIADSKKKLK